MATFSDLSQEKDVVEALRQDHDHLTRGHNTLSATISGSTLDHAELEFRLDGADWQRMVVFGEEAAQQPIDEPSDGTILTGVSLREAFDIRWVDWEKQDRLIIIWGAQENPDTGTGEELWWAESPDGNPTSFDNEQVVYSEEGEEESKVEDPKWFYDEIDDVLRVYFEDGGPGITATEHGHIGILDADTKEGKSYSNKRVIGGENWNLDETFASPNVFKFDGAYFITGEEHDTNNQNMLIAKGPSPIDFTQSIISASQRRLDDFDRHINQSDNWLTADKRFFVYTGYFDGSGWVDAPLYTDTFTGGYPSPPWTDVGGSIDVSLGATLRGFNEMFVYGADSGSNTDIEYWELDGTVVTEELDDLGGTVSFNYYQPAVPPDSTVDWRIVAVEDDGTESTSETTSFSVEEVPEPSVKLGDASLGDITLGRT